MFAISQSTQLIAAWYNWGVAIAFAITFVTTLWVFFDSQSNGFGAGLWRWLSLLAAIIVIPSVMLSFSPGMAAGLPQDLLNALAWAGMGATIIALLGLLLYGLGVGIKMPELPETPAAPPSPFAQTEPKHNAMRPTPIPTPEDLAVTQESGTTPPHLGSAGDDTIRIKNVYENELPLGWVVILNGPFAGKEHRLQKITDIGREEAHNDVVLDDRTISRQHARIRYEKGAFVIYDLASANGVLVNGASVQRRVLTHGDRIKLGQVMLGMLLVQEDAVEDEVAA